MPKGEIGQEYRGAERSLKVMASVSCLAPGLLAVLFCASCTSVVRPPDSFVSVSRSSSRIQQDLLKQVVDEQSRVDYRKLAAAPETLNEAYSEIALRSPDSHPESFPSDEEKFAYWLNAYNVATIYGVMQFYPIDSVRDAKPPSLLSIFPGGGFFAAQKFIFGGERYSLYKLENGIIRERFDDARLHFALNCASVGCPDLAREPFQAGQLDEQLERQTRLFINSPKGHLLDHSEKKIRLSAIFDWYREDFEKNGVTVLDYVERYLTDAKPFQEARKNGYELAFLDYDWSLNTQ